MLDPERMAETRPTLPKPPLVTTKTSSGRLSPLKSSVPMFGPKLTVIDVIAPMAVMPTELVRSTRYS